MKYESLGQVAKELVIRDRAGDQNAMATITEASMAAKAKRNSRIIETARLIDMYIKRLPIEPLFSGENKSQSLTVEQAKDYVSCLQSHIGEDNDVPLAIISLAPIMGIVGVVFLADNLPLLGNVGLNKIQEIASGFEKEKEAKAFIFGVENSHNERKLLQVASKLKLKALRAMTVGSLVGQARRMQAVRNPEIPISALSRMAGWEHGE